MIYETICYSLRYLRGYIFISPQSWIGSFWWMAATAQDINCTIIIISNPKKKKKKKKKRKKKRGKDGDGFCWKLAEFRNSPVFELDLF